MTLPVVFTANGPSGYNLTKSLRFRSSASAYLNRTPSTGNRKTWTFSFWCKRGKLGTYQTPLWATTTGGTYDGTFVWLFDGDNFGLIDYHSGYGAAVTTNAVYRDPSAWYHFICAVDTTQATASNRVKLYVNGELITSLGGTTYPSQNYDFDINANVAHNIGRDAPAIGARNYFDGEFTEINFIDGQQLTPSSFGSTNATTGVWQPAKYTGTYGTNGYYLQFTDVATTSGSNAGLGKDFSGNGNYWNTNNISVTAGSTYDSMTDVPTLTSATTANTATINPLDYVNSNTGSLTATNGNLLVTRSTTAYGGFPATIALPTSGKFAFEFTASQAFNGSTNEAYFGIGVQSNGTFTNSSATGTVSDYYTAVNITGGTGAVYKKFSGGSSTSHYAGTGAVGSGDVFQFLVDMTNGTIDIKKNGSTYGTQVTGLPTTIPLYPYISMYGSVSMSVNFGQQPFASTPTSGYVALNTYNLPTSTIVQGNKYMDATTYTGTGSSYSVTNTASFKPDFVWVKERSQTQDHALFDSVRGATKQLSSNTTGAEATYANSLSAFNSNGFTVVSDAVVNSSGQTYVGWQWQAGQGTTSSNTNGSITSTVSVNASAGFSIVTYTGNGSSSQTVGHGLGVAPYMVITKGRSGPAGSTNWMVYHRYLNNGTNPAQYYLQLNSTNAQGGLSSVWQDTAPTSTVFSLGSNGDVNYSGESMVAYCWTPIAGFSAFGSYTGNGSTDGPFVYTGFRPKFVLIKASSTGGGGYDWFIHDTSRDTYNVCTLDLEANLSLSENQYGAEQDIVSNGFKLRNAGGGTNQSGVTYIYACFAENPFKNALAR